VGALLDRVSDSELRDRLTAHGSSPSGAGPGS